MVTGSQQIAIRKETHYAQSNVRLLGSQPNPPGFLFDSFLFSVTCVEGWFGWGNSCYKIQKTQPTIQKDALFQDGMDCQRQDDLLFVPNSKDEILFMSHVLKGIKTIQNNQFNPGKALIGAVFTHNSRYIEYIDGIGMLDGEFPNGQSIKDLQIGPNTSCLNLNSSGGIEACDGQANIQICERTIKKKNTHLCLEQSGPWFWKHILSNGSFHVNQCF